MRRSRVRLDFNGLPLSAQAKACWLEEVLSTDPLFQLSQASRELWFVAPRTVELRRTELPLPGPGEILVRGLYSGISQGTEMLLYRGQGPTPFDPSMDAPDQATYPRRYGYAWVGEVVALADGELNICATVPLGARVFALLPHAEFHILKATSASLLAPNIPPERAVLASNLETAITCVWDAGISLGDRVVVLGGGIVGQLTAWLARFAGGQVRLVEPSARRLEVARFLGVHETFTPELDVPSGEADVVIEATGDPATLDRAIAHAGVEATVVVASFYGAKVADVRLGSAFHRKRLSLKASQVSRVPASRLTRWSLSRRFELVRSLLQRPELDALLDVPVPFEQAAAQYSRIEKSPGDGLQTVFRYHS